MGHTLSGSNSEMHMRFLPCDCGPVPDCAMVGSEGTLNPLGHGTIFTVSR